MSKYTESEVKILQAMADVFYKAAQSCADSANRNPSPTGESFWATHIVMRAIACDLRKEIVEESC